METSTEKGSEAQSLTFREICGFPDRKHSASFAHFHERQCCVIHRTLDEEVSMCRSRISDSLDFRRNEDQSVVQILVFFQSPPHCFSPRTLIPSLTYIWMYSPRSILIHVVHTWDLRTLTLTLTLWPEYICEKLALIIIHIQIRFFFFVITIRPNSAGLSLPCARFPNFPFHQQVSP
jgi:hypothetical protein